MSNNNVEQAYLQSVLKEVSNNLDAFLPLLMQIKKFDVQVWPAMVKPNVLLLPTFVAQNQQTVKQIGVLSAFLYDNHVFNMCSRFSDIVTSHRKETHHAIDAHRENVIRNFLGFNNSGISANGFMPTWQQAVKAVAEKRSGYVEHLITFEKEYGYLRSLVFHITDLNSYSQNHNLREQLASAMVEYYRKIAEERTDAIVSSI